MLQPSLLPCHTDAQPGHKNEQKKCNIQSHSYRVMNVTFRGFFNVIATFHLFRCARPKKPTPLRGFYLIVKYSGEAVNILMYHRIGMGFLSFIGTILSPETIGDCSRCM